MFFFLSKTLDFFLMPVSLLLLLLAYAYFTKIRNRSRSATLAALVLLYVLCNKFLVNEAYQWWEFPPVNIAEIPPGYDVGIVLTGGMISMPYPALDHASLGVRADRFFQAYRLYKAGKIKKILISGADRPDVMKRRQDDGAQAAYFLRLWGVPSEDIILENQSRNTYQNAKNTALILNKEFPQGRFLLITSAFHLPRASGCFTKAGIKTKAFPTDQNGVALAPTLKNIFRPDPDMFGYTHQLWREWVGYLVYRLVGYC